MKETVKGSRISGYLEKMYRELNNDFFGGELEEVFITIQPTPMAYGHVTCSKVWKTGDTHKYELNIGASTMDRPIEHVVATLLHEMVHIYHLQHGIQDCSRGNTYHNKKFKEKAESVGLIISHDKTYGWTITEPSDDLILYICEKGWIDIMSGRNDGLRIVPPSSGDSGRIIPPSGTPKTKKPSSTRKYACPCCGISVRATKEVRIVCADCSELMILA